jgi:hypothetical protein
MWRTAIAGLIFLPSLSFAQYYKCVQADGKIAFQDTPCAANATTKIIPTQESKDHSDPIKAAAMIEAMAETISRMEQWCQTNYSPAHTSIVEARAKWLERHEKLLTKAKQILAEKLNEDERRTLAQVSVSENDRVIASLEKAGGAKFKEWCTGIPPKTVSPEMNLNGKLVLVNTIKNYKLENPDKPK